MSGFSGGFSGSRRPDAPRGPPLPMHLMNMFTPRPPIEYLKPIHKKTLGPYSGVSKYVNLDNFESREVWLQSRVKHRVPETRDQRYERVKKEREARGKQLIEERETFFKPSENPESTKDPFKTLFVGRLAFVTDEIKLKREFEDYGKIKSIKLVHDKQGKPRGYAFIEYEEERSVKEAFDRADGRKIDGRRVLVDVERGRTVKGWKPRSLGGGKGSTRIAKEKKPKKGSQGQSSGGFGGGGGFRR